MKTESMNQRKQELYKKEYQFKISVHNMDKYLKVISDLNLYEIHIKRYPFNRIQRGFDLKYTVILSFLKRERESTVKVFHNSFQCVTIGSPFLSEFSSMPYRIVPYRIATDRLSF